MKDVILLELAQRWISEADGTSRAEAAQEVVQNARSRGRREGLREAADMLKMLVSLLGEGNGPRL